MHLLIPFAACDEPACRNALGGLELPNLRWLLSQFAPQDEVRAPNDTVTLPHERVLATARGLAPLAPAWAALRAHELGLARALGRGWAFVTPCHWEVGQARVILRDPRELALDEAQSRALLVAMQPFFEEDGLTLHYDQPQRWLVEGEALRDLTSASPERVIRRDVAAWLPASPLLRRLQNEMQMLLYTHAVNEARADSGQHTVNSFWLSGSGVLDAAPLPTGPVPQVLSDLTGPALSGDWTAWQAAWRRIDAERLADVRSALASGQTVLRLTLCGEQRACSYGPAAAGWWQRVRAQLGARRVSEILGAL